MTAKDVDDFFMSDKVPEPPPEPTPAVPRGYCQCGCGGKTSISRQNHAKFGWVKGQPKKFIRGHKTLPPLDERGPFRIDGIVCFLVPLTHNQFAVVEQSDLLLLSRFRWWAHWDKESQKFYAVGSTMQSGERQITPMSRLILGVSGDIKVDHKNGETLRNIHSNLRPATQQQNNCNTRLHKHTSQYRGVSWHKSANKWHAQISCNNVKYNLGFSDFEIAVAKLYDAAAIRLHGEFARTNFGGN